MFAVSGIMQAILLIICIAWKIRQKRLHIDDFGHPLPGNPLYDPAQAHSSEVGRVMDAANDESEEDRNEDDVSTLGADARAMEHPSIANEELAQALLDGEREPLLGNGKKPVKFWQRVFRR